MIKIFDKTMLVAVLLLILFGLALSPVYAALGDVLRTFEYGDRGGGLAFDGWDTLYYTRLYPPTTHLPGYVHIDKFKTDGSEWVQILLGLDFQPGGLAWDSTRNGLWVGLYRPPSPTGGYSRTQLYFLTIPGLTLTYEFDIADFTHYDASMVDPPAGFEPGILGLEYDSSTDTLWICQHGAHRIYHCTPDGTEIGYFDTLIPSTDDYWDCNGIALDGNGQLWLSQSAHAQHQMLLGDQVYKYTQSGTYLGLAFSPATITWTRGIAFDPVTFPNKWALWIIGESGSDVPVPKPIGAFEISTFETGVSEFEIAIPIIMSIATALYLGISKRQKK